MKLKEINSEDLLFSNEIDDDRINTFLSLDDYGWMNYRLKTRFKTLDLGTLDVDFQYFGTTYSFMVVEQTKDGKTEEYRYEYPSSIFTKHIIKFLTNHINSWDSRYAFNGEENVIDFYNEVIKTGTIIPQ